MFKRKLKGVVFGILVIGVDLGEGGYLWDQNPLIKSRLAERPTPI
jgi:hypothetical protein